MIFQFSRAQDRKQIRHWLNHADTLLGANLQYDLAFLLAHPDTRWALSDRKQTIIDILILNYLHNECIPGRDLKSISARLLIHKYERTAKDRFPNSQDEKAVEYNCTDAHATMLGVAELARRIEADWPGSPKAQEFSLQFYSDLIWFAVRVSSPGIPMDLRRLNRLESWCTYRMAKLKERMENEFGLQLSGKGSKTATNPKSLPAFLASILEVVGPEALDNPLIGFTKKKKEIKFDEVNREVLSDLLPEDHPKRAALDVITTFSTMQKLRSSYTFPLLRGAVTNPDNTKEVLLPCVPLPLSGSSSSPSGSSASATVATPKFEIGLGFPTIFLTPSQFKDSNEEGGQQQARPSFKNPKAQTFPPIIKNQMRSRHPRGVIASIDLSQAELRMAALLSGDKRLLEAFRTNADLHSDTAIETFGYDNLLIKYGLIQYRNEPKRLVKHPGFKQLERQAGKHSNFTMLNLGAATMLQRTIKKKAGISIPLEICEKMVGARPRLYPELVAWQKALIAQVERDGYLVLPFTGHSRYFLNFSRSDRDGKNTASEIVNFPIQAQTAITFLRVQHYLDLSLPDFRIPSHPAQAFLQVYDAAYYDLPDRSFIPTFKELAAAAVRKVETDDYWAWCQNDLGRVVPLGFDLTLH